MRLEFVLKKVYNIDETNKKEENMDLKDNVENKPEKKLFNPCYEHCFLKYGKEYTKTITVVVSKPIIAVASEAIYDATENKIY